MMTDQHDKSLGEKLVEGYNQMLKRIRETAVETETDTEHALKNRLEAAMEKASELGELSREEAEKISDYVKRDLEAAADFIGESGKELKDWLRFDLDVVEQELGKLFAQMVDHTRMELDKLERQATQYGEWHTGEVASIGTLECKSCGELLHLHHTSHIPPCPKCHGTTYRRLSHQDDIDT